MTRTRLAWLSPFSAASEISCYTHAVLPHLVSDATGAPMDVSLFSNANGRAYPSPVPRADLPAGGGMAEILSTFDAAVYNIGNNAENHGRVLEHLRRAPGIVVLHDVVLQHLIAHLCIDVRQDRVAYARLMHEAHQAAGLDVVLSSRIAGARRERFVPWDTEYASRFPLVQPVADLASALVVHSRFSAEICRRFFHGPILTLFLPSDLKPAPDQVADAGPDSDPDAGPDAGPDASPDTCRFTAFGFVNRTKCLDRAILAIASSDALRARARLLIAGVPLDRDYAQELERLVDRLGLRRQVAFEYSVGADRLTAIKRDTDVFLNTRWPNTEGASASLNEQMNAGRPAIVFDSGCFAEVPPGTVVPIPPDAGPDALADAMLALLHDPPMRARIGAAARSHVRPRDSASYARQFKSFLWNTGGLLRRRRSLISPMPADRGWDARDMASDDLPWLRALSSARSCWASLDADRHVHGPAPFLQWSDDSLAGFVAEICLDTPHPARLRALLAALARDHGRWALYRFVEEVRQRCAMAQDASLPQDAALSRATSLPVWAILHQMSDQVFSVVCYMAILGRRPGQDEVDARCRDLHAGKHRTWLVRAFLDSSEYAARYPDQAMEPVRAWAASCAVWDAPMPTGMDTPAIALPPAGSVRLASVDHAVLAALGWDVPDGGDPRSKRPFGRLCLGMLDDRAGTPLAMMLHGRVAGPPGCRLHVVVDGVPLTSIEVPPTGAFACPVTIPHALWPAHALELALVPTWPDQAAANPRAIPHDISVSEIAIAARTLRGSEPVLQRAASA